METATLNLWDTGTEALVSSAQIHGRTLEAALARAVAAGYASGLDFHIVEAAGRPPQLYWNGLGGDPRWGAMTAEHRDAVIATHARAGAR